MTARQTRRSLVAALIKRDGGSLCRYCGQDLKPWQITVDHVRPLARGGAKRDRQNLVIACRPCNHVKKNRTPEEAGMVLRPPRVLASARCTGADRG